MTNFYAGLWISGTDANYYSLGHDLASFTALATERHEQSLALIGLRTYKPETMRLWAGIWRAGTDANYFSVDKDIASFTDLAAQRHKENLRLVDIETYVENGQRLWAGIWRAGTDANYFSVDKDIHSFIDLATQRHGQGLRLTCVRTYGSGAGRRWAGIWRAGTDANYFSVDKDLHSFIDLATQRHQQNLCLVDLETYEEGGQRLWAGVWRAGTEANYFNVQLDEEKLLGLAHERHKKQLALIGLCVYPTPADPKAFNQVVMPARYQTDDGKTQTNNGYIYGIQSTANHCEGLPGTCGAPGPGAVVLYRWPVDVEGATRYARISSISVPDQFLTLPFNDTGVKRLGIWRYGDGGWHHGGDYGKGGPTFQVKAAAPGRVLFTGYDAWSGNTVVMSHDVDGQQDAYRTIYMHMRNGATADCAAAWNVSVPLVQSFNNSQQLADYQKHLTDTGCTQNSAQRNPDPAYWGDDTQKIEQALLMKMLPAGAVLGWAGCTGPGGQGKPGGPNTHLHMFWARRDPADNRWYFFDPYGIYARPEHYPAGVTDAIPTAYLRYPVAWKGGRPQYSA